MKKRQNQLNLSKPTKSGRQNALLLKHFLYKAVQKTEQKCVADVML